MKRRAALVLTVLLLTACGTTSSPRLATGAATGERSPMGAASPPTSSQSPASTAGSPSSEILFAVTEGGSATGSEPGTVVIVGMDGYSRAKAHFQPRVRAQIPDAAVPQQGVAEAIGSAIYYIDAAGVVRVLRVGSQPQVVATFPLQPAQEDAWFAVSPDGSNLMAGVLTLPALGPPVNGAPWPTLVGPAKFVLETAAAGGQTTILQSFESNQLAESGGRGWTLSFPVGWTPAGAVVMEPVSIGTQNAWWGGPMYIVDGKGNRIQQIGGSDCDSAAVTARGFIACTSGQYAVTVREISGTSLWTTHVDGFNALTLYVSPDGQAISDGRQVEVRSSGIVSLPQGFVVEGWLDNDTVMVRRYIGNGPDMGDLSWIRLSQPTKINDLGFKGDFVGTLGQS